MVQISCNNQEKCDKRWLSAKEFINKHSKLKIIFDTDSVYTTVSPQQSKVLAYTVSKTHTEFNKMRTERVSLKIRCEPSRIGEKLCKSQLVTDQLKTFKEIVTAAK